MRRRLAALLPYVPEIALAVAFVAGWILVTVGIAAVAPSRVVWPLSSGFLLLSCCGWAFLRDIARDGLYTLALTKTSAHYREPRKPAVRKVS